MKKLFLLLAAALLPTTATAEEPFWRGVDLSYVNELEDCGATWTVAGKPDDPYNILAQAGANYVRLRLWHGPAWTDYSTLPDVRKSIARAKDAGMKVLLDFHYSDDWTHPGKQMRPAAWADAETAGDLADRLATYTRDTLLTLHEEGLMPDAVQIGNETNSNVLWPVEEKNAGPIDWARNAMLLNAGIRAAQQVEAATGHDLEIMLHIAQPENVEDWMAAGREAGLLPVDLMGVSYYPEWSTMSLTDLQNFMKSFQTRWKRRVVIVETAYPFTLEGNDGAGNLIGADSLMDGYPASIDGQRRFMMDLSQTVREAGGAGVVYWEPAWISSTCETRWGTGSHWENAALFDFDGNLTAAAQFLRP